MPKKTNSFKALFLNNSNSNSNSNSNKPITKKLKSTDKTNQESTGKQKPKTLVISTKTLNNKLKNLTILPKLPIQPKLSNKTNTKLTLQKLNKQSYKKSHQQSYQKSQSYQPPQSEEYKLLANFFDLIAEKWCKLNYGCYIKIKDIDYILYAGDQFDDNGNKLTHIEFTQCNAATKIIDSLDFNNHLHLQYGFGDEKIGIVTQRYDNSTLKGGHICILNGIYDYLTSNIFALDKLIENITQHIYANSGYVLSKKGYYMDRYTSKVSFFKYLNRQLNASPSIYIKDFTCTDSQNLKFISKISNKSKGSASANVSAYSSSIEYK